VTIKRSLLTAVVLFTAVIGLGWGDSWESIRAEAGTVTSVQTQFVQFKHMPILAKPLESRGVLIFQVPGSLRWEYRRPIASVLLMYDGRVKRYIKDDNGFRLEENTGLDAMQVVLEEISRWLTGRFTDNPMFEADLQPGRRIRLTPKQASFTAVIQHIELYLGSQPGTIEKVVIYENSDTYTELRFSNTVLNQVIKADVFQQVP
jgi:outer membrane lipoprotein-sorting protein